MDLVPRVGSGDLFGVLRCRSLSAMVAARADSPGVEWPLFFWLKRWRAPADPFFLSHCWLAGVEDWGLANHDFLPPND